MTLPYEEGTERRGNLGCSVIGWLVFVLLLGTFLIVAQKTYFYYGKIRKGEIVDLPQFQQQLSASKKPTLDRSDVDRALIEGEDALSTGAEASAAELTIVAFIDFECPFSKQEYPVIGQMLAKYGDRVRFVLHHYPLEDIHVHAMDAAIAAECAQEQGMFWPYYERLFQNSPALGYTDLLRYAEGAGLEPMQFSKCIDDQRYKSKVVKDVDLALKAGVVGTPVFFFNGQKVEGAIPADVFENIIRQLLPQK